MKPKQHRSGTLEQNLRLPFPQSALQIEGYIKMNAVSLSLILPLLFSLFADRDSSSFGEILRQNLQNKEKLL